MHLFVLSFLLLPLILLAEEVNLPTTEMPEEGFVAYNNENGFRYLGAGSVDSVKFSNKLHYTDKNTSDFLWESPKQAMPSLVERPFVNPKILGRDFQSILADGYLDNVVIEVDLEMAGSSERYFYTDVKLGKWIGGEYPIIRSDINQLESHWYKAFKTSDPEIFIILMGEYSGGTQNWYDHGIVKISKKTIIKAPYDKKPLEYKDTFVITSLGKLPVEIFGNKEKTDYYLKGIGIELIEWQEK